MGIYYRSSVINFFKNETSQQKSDILEDLMDDAQVGDIFANVREIKNTIVGSPKSLDEINVYNVSQILRYNLIGIDSQTGTFSFQDNDDLSLEQSTSISEVVKALNNAAAKNNDSAQGYPLEDHAGAEECRQALRLQAMQQLQLIKNHLPDITG